MSSVEVFRVALVAVLLALGIAGCGHRQPKPEMQLTMVAVNGWIGRAEFDLQCSPAGGDFPALPQWRHDLDNYRSLPL
ncbi:MAG TPA: hypothetical protein VMV08_04440 [Gaiellaceae bacterium]|nr:hypothetical protein [Gaiellaceae bacterium]